MTQAEKLEALIQKAIDGGWDNHTLKGQDDGANWVIDGLSVSYPFGYSYIEIRFKWFDKETEQLTSSYAIHLNDLLFNHDFARALFGEGKEPARDEFEHPDEYKNIDGDRFYMTVDDQTVWDSRGRSYQYHLQQAVISDDPIDYMYKAVFDQ